MKTPMLVFVAAGAFGAAIHAAGDPLDRVDDALTWSDASGQWRAHVSGTFDLEGYAVPLPPPGVIDAEGHLLFNPRLSVFLDAQLGPSVYAFAQFRADRGFDPSSDPLRTRADEYALRWAVHGAKLNFQVGKFATVVGNWTGRHDSWTNPFVTAPLPYENLTGIWDTEPPHSSGQLLVWSHVRPGLPPSVVQNEKYLRLPIIWGPSYTTGAAVAGDVDRFRYAIEFKNGSLSSRPDTWSANATQWNHPTVSGRLSYSPDEMWEFGWSASTGSYLRSSADRLIPAPYSRGDYREIVVGEDVSFAWHHVQIWGEVYGARFAIPGIGNADTLAYYIEGKYKFTPQFFGAVRWNQQMYGTLLDRGRDVRWGRDLWRFDVGPAWRFSPHVQLKLQYSLGRGDTDDNRLTSFGAVQFTVRF